MIDAIKRSFTEKNIWSGVVVGLFIFMAGSYFLVYPPDFLRTVRSIALFAWNLLVTGEGWAETGMGIIPWGIKAILFVTMLSLPFHIAWQFKPYKKIRIFSFIIGLYLSAWITMHWEQYIHSQAIAIFNGFSIKGLWVLAVNAVLLGSGPAGLMAIYLNKNEKKIIIEARDKEFDSQNDRKRWIKEQIDEQGFDQKFVRYWIIFMLLMSMLLIMGKMQEIYQEQRGPVFEKTFVFLNDSQATALKYIRYENNSCVAMAQNERVRFSCNDIFPNDSKYRGFFLAISIPKNGDINVAVRGAYSLINGREGITLDGKYDTRSTFRSAVSEILSRADEALRIAR